MLSSRYYYKLPIQPRSTQNHCINGAFSLCPTRKLTVCKTFYTMGLSGLPRNTKHELCTFCRSQRVLSSRLCQNVHNKCFLFCGNPRRQPILWAIHYTYEQKIIQVWIQLWAWNDNKTFSLRWVFYAMQVDAHEKRLVPFSVHSSSVYLRFLSFLSAVKYKRQHT